MRRLDTALHLQRDHIRRYALALRRISATLVGMNPDLLSSQWREAASQDMLNVLAEDSSSKPGSRKMTMSKKDSKKSKKDSGSQLVKANKLSKTAQRTTLDAGGDRKQAGEILSDLGDGSPLEADSSPQGGVSESRREEVRNLMFNSFKKIVSYLKEWKTRLPCVPSGSFRMKMKPDAMLQPLEKETQNFLDKYKNLGKEYLTLCVEGLQVLEQCDEGLALARKADTFAKHERDLAWKNLTTIIKHEQRIAELKAEVKAWEKSERKRQRAEKKKAEKESAKREQRRQALENSKKRRAGFSVKTVTAADLSQIPGYEANPHEGSSVEESASAGPSAVLGEGGGQLVTLDSQDTPLQVSVPAVPPARRSSVETGGPTAEGSRKALMPQASSLITTLAAASEAAASSTEASRKREEVSLSFLDEPAPAANDAVKMPMFANVVVSDEEREMMKRKRRKSATAVMVMAICAHRHDPRDGKL